MEGVKTGNFRGIKGLENTREIQTNSVGMNVMCKRQLWPVSAPGGQATLFKVWPSGGDAEVSERTRACEAILLNGSSAQTLK